MEGLVLKGSIEPGTVIRRQGDPFLQSVHQIGVADKVATVQKSIVFTRFHNSPGVLVVPPTSGEERSGPKDLTETIKGHIQQAPARKELVLLFRAEDLFIALGGLAVEPRLIRDQTYRFDKADIRQRGEILLETLAQVRPGLQTLFSARLIE